MRYRTIKPDPKIARKVLPPGLRHAIEHVFNQTLEGVALVGGTALAGYYAGHRRSDDIDLFVRDKDAFQAAVLAVESLVDAGGSKVTQIQKSGQFYRALFEYEGHQFTADVVLDGNFHSVAEPVLCDGILIATPIDLLGMKMATLVSRASEKDLYDLIWLLQHFPSRNLASNLELGLRYDGGLSAENALLTLASTKPQQSACSFAKELGNSASKVCNEIQTFRKGLIRELTDLAKKQKTISGLSSIKNELK